MMTLAKVEHILRAAGNATGQRDYVLIGSAAIFVWCAVVPADMAMTREADIFADIEDVTEAERISDELDAVLGQASLFDATHGYYCDGVGPDTAILPLGWRARAKRFSSENTNGVQALAPEPNDIAAAKLCAGRPKDIDWLVAAMKAEIIDLTLLSDRAATLPADRAPAKDILDARLSTISSRSTHPTRRFD